MVLKQSKCTYCIIYVHIFVPICFEYLRIWNFRSFPFVHIVLEEFGYTARVQHALVAVEQK